MTAIVLHTSGEPDLDKVVKFYTDENGFQPHYLVEPTRTVRKFVDENRVAYHTAIEPAEANLYSMGLAEWTKWNWPLSASTPMNVSVKYGGAYPGYAPWIARWPGKKSPLELVTGAHPNGRSIGIELLPPLSPPPLGFEDSTFETASALVRDLAASHGIALDRDHILSHSSCSPMRRSKESGGWDPPDGAFDHLLSLLGMG